MIHPPHKIIIFDLEVTAWEGSLKRQWSKQNEYPEIVQIGAILFDTQKLQEVESFMKYVKPVKNPILSDYFVQLTGITQEIVDRNGLAFVEVFEKFKTWANGYPLYSWGGWKSDAVWLKENCEWSGIPLSFPRNQLRDIQGIFKKAGIPTELYSSGTIVKAFGKKPSRRAHDGRNDARTIAEGLRELAQEHFLVGYK